jgi:hypothetical protein
MKKILIILGTLVLILLVLAWINSRQQTPTEGILQITAPDGVQTLKTLPSKELQTIITSKGDLQAIAVSALLKKHIESDNWQNIIFYSSDGAEVRISRAELPLLYLAQITKNQDSYLRLIIPSDNFPQRWLKKINRITLK